MSEASDTGEGFGAEGDLDPEALADIEATAEANVIRDLARERDDMRALAQRVQAEIGRRRLVEPLDVALCVQNRQF